MGLSYDSGQASRRRLYAPIIVSVTNTGLLRIRGLYLRWVRTCAAQVFVEEARKGSLSRAHTNLYRSHLGCCGELWPAWFCVFVAEARVSCLNLAFTT